jgi:hypothetical protein
MPLSREQQNEVNRRAAALGTLAQHPSWDEMEAEVERKIERLQRRATTLALHDDGADQRKLDFIRGTISALRWFVGVPRNAEATLERYLREAGIEIEEE